MYISKFDVIKKIMENGSLSNHDKYIKLYLLKQETNRLLIDIEILEKELFHSMEYCKYCDKHYLKKFWTVEEKENKYYKICPCGHEIEMGKVK